MLVSASDNSCPSGCFLEWIFLICFILHTWRRGCSSFTERWGIFGTGSSTRRCVSTSSQPPCRRPLGLWHLLWSFWLIVSGCYLIVFRGRCAPGYIEGLQMLWLWPTLNRTNHGFPSSCWGGRLRSLEFTRSADAITNGVDVCEILHGSDVGGAGGA